MKLNRQRGESMTFKTEKPLKGKTSDETIENMFTYLCRLADALNYHLNNIDEANCTEKFSERVDKNG